MVSKNACVYSCGVLITLGVIGVVAAITIPTLMKNAQDAELKRAWKKEYSVFSQAISKMKMDNGGDLSGIMTNSWDTLYDALTDSTYLKVCKNINIPVTTEVGQLMTKN